MSLSPVPTCAVTEEQEEDKSPGHGAHSPPETSELEPGCSRHLSSLLQWRQGGGGCSSKFVSHSGDLCPTCRPAEVCTWFFRQSGLMGVSEFAPWEGPGRKALLGPYTDP